MAETHMPTATKPLKLIAVVVHLAGNTVEDYLPQNLGMALAALASGLAHKLVLNFVDDEKNFVGITLFNNGNEVPEWTIYGMRVVNGVAKSIDGIPTHNDS